MKSEILSKSQQMKELFSMVLMGLDSILGPTVIRFHQFFQENVKLVMCL